MVHPFSFRHNSGMLVTSLYSEKERDFVKRSGRVVHHGRAKETQEIHH